MYKIDSYCSKNIAILEIKKIYYFKIKKTNGELDIKKGNWTGVRGEGRREKWNEEEQ